MTLLLQSHRLLLLLLLVLLLISSCHSFTPCSSNMKRGWDQSLFHSKTNTNSEEAPNLYVILGASPKDSDQELKKKWQRLAKQLHPDANVGGTGSSYEYDLADVNAAWGVLSDPKERRRYDRALQAQELADTFEILLDAGIKTAIPFLQKTANGAVKFGEKSNQVMNDVNKKMKLNSQIYDLDTEAMKLDRKASNVETRYQRLQYELQNQSSKQNKSLQTHNAPLSSKEAIRLLNRFALNENETTQSKRSYGTFADTDVEIEYLEDLEYNYKELLKFHQSTLKNMNRAQQQANDAIMVEQEAQKRLAQAQQDLADAQARNHACQKAQFEAAQIEKEALVDANQAGNLASQQTEKVRYILQQKEMESLEREAQIMRAKMRQLELDQEGYRRAAMDLKAQANNLRLRAKEV